MSEEVRLGIDVACTAAHQASLADEPGVFLWRGCRFRTTTADLERLWPKIPDGVRVVVQRSRDLYPSIPRIACIWGCTRPSATNRRSIRVRRNLPHLVNASGRSAVSPARATMGHAIPVANACWQLVLSSRWSRTLK